MYWNSTSEDTFWPPKLKPPYGRSISPAEAMDLCFQSAFAGVGYTSPNPLVGAVVCSAEGVLLGVGGHQACGGPHAEVHACQDATAQYGESCLQGAHVFVSLEPCAHHGRTPACASMLAEKKVAKVTYAVDDPNPLVAGKGLTILRNAGIQVEHWQEESPRFKDLIAPFIWHTQHRSPYVALKAGLSLDGSIALPGASRVWITGERARRCGHFLRQRYDAIAVGKTTVMLDNPSLEPRIPGNTRPPWRIVFDPTGKCLTQEGITLAAESSKVIWVLDESQKIPPHLLDHIDSIAVSRHPSGHLDISQVLGKLETKGIHSLLLEGGSGLYGSFLAQGAVNRLYLFCAPHRLLGPQGIRWSQALEQDLTLDIDHISLCPLENDLLLDIALNRNL